MPSTATTIRVLPPRLRRALLTLHIVAGVALLGDCAVIVAFNVRAATTSDPALAAAAYDLLVMLPIVFGIPLSMASLASGIALGLGSKWGVLRHRWVTVKLVLNVSVILAGALVLGPQTTALSSGDGGSQAAVIAGSAYDVAALCLATALSVYKPRRRRR